MEVKIRKVKPEEGKILAEIEEICFPPEEAASEKDVLERLQAFPDKFLAAEADGKIIGFINGAVTDEPHLPDEMYHDTGLHKPDGMYQTAFGLNVLPQYRRQGIAGKLVDALIELSKKEGKKGVVLTCKDHLIPFYESHGFVNYGVADSEHGGARWNDMQLHFSER